MMKVSSHGIALIMNFEDLRTAAYKPVSSEKGWTIGYGHHGPDVKQGMVCTEQWAYEQLQRDLRQVEHQLISALNADEIEVNQNQFDALLSFTYNCGITRLTNSSLWKSLKSGVPNSDLFLQYKSQGGKYLAGLLRRRVAEIYLFEGADWHEGNDLVLEYVRIRRANNIMLKNTRQQTIDAQVYLKVDHLDGLLSFVAKHE